MEAVIHALNEKILALTMKIRESHPELSGFIEEMPVSVPNEKDPHVQVKQLQAYYNSLHNLLSKYELEHGEQHQ